MALAIKGRSNIYWQSKSPDRNLTYKTREIEIGKKKDYYRMELADIVSNNDDLWEIAKEQARKKKWRALPRSRFKELPTKTLYGPKKTTLLFYHIESKLNEHRNHNDELDNALDGVYDARNELFELDQYLVPYLLKLKGLNLSDKYPELLQQGNMALMEAAHKFDYKFGFKFDTYAVSYFDRYIKRALLANSNSVIHIPECVDHKLLSIVSQLDNSNVDREMLIKEIANDFHLTVDKVNEYLKLTAIKKTVSLSKHIYHENGDGESKILENVIADKHSTDFEQEIMREDIMDKIKRQLATRLNERDYDVMVMRMENYTLKEIGEKYGLTRERIRQIENEGKQYLRMKFT